MLKNNPDYLAFLEGLDPVNKAQLLHGNWNVKAEGNNYFKRDRLIEVDSVPSGAVYARGWDLASQEVTTQNKDCDFSTGIKLAKDREGFYYLLGDHCSANYDELLDEYGRFRKRPAERDRTIIEQGFHDGVECTIVLPIDPGAAGKVAFQELAKRIISEGLSVKADPCPTNKDKLTKFTPFADAVEAGLVRIVRRTFDLKSYNSLMAELERFSGERSGRAANMKDDRPDACATAFNWLAQKKISPIVRRNQAHQKTIASNMLVLNN